MRNNNRQSPQFASWFLRERAQEAMGEISALSKVNLKGSADDFAASLIFKHQIQLLELGHHKAIIPESALNTVKITWPITGDERLIGLRTADEKFLTSATGQAITEVLRYPVPLSENEFNRKAAKESIERSTASYKAHFAKINAEVEAHNQLLADAIPNSVKLKFEALTKLREAEDFLN